ncbi:DUF768 domain-containing protein [Mesorhizobium sp. BR1-1-9]|uniref:DUF768 domain-containing protein n=1 Tax=unclassified Mesorhizobium TaxID=325217 RepID=UPI001128E129|nr:MULTISPECIES: DUF768 domain-containing protein [unclassified Mesorhizobium]MBZ9810345.1 DUF768 domain-containing protein [Mesorhizobium sp. ESP-6-2]MBZ9872210.1 DUF768 domain-containing protein [Mesorhizobium sp. BR1-1-9]MBZ9943094.1 DUF768 domain-containing protein [Mesorhizobium sp. BR1-1-13]TPM24911.1 DUF768 domain-containing protein [Mesorhizobium sp. B2-2-2]
MSATIEFFRTWLQENVGNLATDTQVSVAVLAQQFEQDADAAGYGREVREEDIGNIEDAIQQALDKTSATNGRQPVPEEDGSLTPIIEGLEAAEPEHSASAAGDGRKEES